MRWIDHHHQRGDADAGDGCDVADKIELEILVERRVDCVRRIDKQERVAVGGARMTASVAILVAAPARFSTTKGWPNRSDNDWPISRAAMSATPPVAKPTMMRTGRVG
jgi:hypothetical protein